MSNPLADAIKKKRMGAVNMDMPQHDEPDGDEGQGKDLLGLVASLSPEERMKMKDILHASTSNESEIQKGAPSADEQDAISKQMQANDQRQQMDDAGKEGDEMTEPDSDDIGASMLDSKYRNGPTAGNPRNLGERVKNAIATKLKGKGKL